MGSLSAQVSAVLLSMMPTIETYSIDESFLNLVEFRQREVEPLRVSSASVHRWVGIPTYVGIAPEGPRQGRHLHRKEASAVSWRLRPTFQSDAG
jgi:hypothetical protein